jgi:hypothetical protein
VPLTRPSRPLTLARPLQSLLSPANATAAIWPAPRCHATPSRSRSVRTMVIARLHVSQANTVVLSQIVSPSPAALACPIGRHGGARSFPCTKPPRAAVPFHHQLCAYLRDPQPLVCPFHCLFCHRYVCRQLSSVFPPWFTIASTPHRLPSSMHRSQIAVMSRGCCRSRRSPIPFAREKLHRCHAVVNPPSSVSESTAPFRPPSLGPA